MWNLEEAARRYEAERYIASGKDPNAVLGWVVEVMNARNHRECWAQAQGLKALRAAVMLTSGHTGEDAR